ncbi:hypothetical protein OSTOST_20763, partial [Ostertagia ostertagi]
MGNEEVKLTAFDMMAMIKQCLSTLREQKNESYKLIPAALRLDPDEVDKRDTDCNDYRVFQGRQFRVSAKDEAAFEQLRLLKLAATTRRTKRSRVVIDYSENEEGKNEEMTEKLKKAEQERAIAAEKRRKAADEKKKATWNANAAQRLKSFQQ